MAGGNKGEKGSCGVEVAERKTGVGKDERYRKTKSIGGFIGPGKIKSKRGRPARTSPREVVRPQTRAASDRRRNIGTGHQMRNLRKRAKEDGVA